MNYFEVYGTVWNFHKKYASGDGLDAYWAQVIKEADDIIDKYSGDSFVRELIMCVLAELERREKQKGK